MKTTALVVCAMLVSACYTAPPSGGPSKSTFVINDYKSRQPVDVAILPVTVAASKFPASGQDRLRAHLYRALLEKGYSPLSIDYVDARVGGMFATGVGGAGGQPVPIDALRSSLDADAYLFVDVEKSETASGSEGGGWRLQARIKLLEARTGTTLFDQTAVTTYDVKADSSGNLSDRDADDALRRYAGRLTSSIPNRS